MIARDYDPATGRSRPAYCRAFTARPAEVRHRTECVGSAATGQRRCPRLGECLAAQCDRKSREVPPWRG